MADADQPARDEEIEMTYVKWISMLAEIIFLVVAYRNNARILFLRFYLTVGITYT